ncbi:hypothetical protein A8A09_04645 [Klebsiella variicola]|nr:hypothetical protein A8A09_04645 [Klebsiella variicola]
MVTAIYLYQFATTGPAIAWLLNFWRTLLTGDPETGFNHERPDSFFGQVDIVQFCKLLTRQRRPKVCIALTYNTECIPGKAIRQLIIAGFPTTTISHTKWARFTVTRQKPSALAIRDAQSLSCHLSCQTAINNILNFLLETPGLLTS